MAHEQVSYNWTQRTALADAGFSERATPSSGLTALRFFGALFFVGASFFFGAAFFFGLVCFGLFFLIKSSRAMSRTVAIVATRGVTTRSQRACTWWQPHASNQSLHYACIFHSVPPLLRLNFLELAGGSTELYPRQAKNVL